jgi:hypothetical protein
MSTAINWEYKSPIWKTSEAFEEYRKVDPMTARRGCGANIKKKGN